MLLLLQLLLSSVAAGLTTEESERCSEVWEVPACSADGATCHTCGARIEWLHSSQGYSDPAARAFVSREHPEECGDCMVACTSIPACTSDDPSLQTDKECGSCSDVIPVCDRRFSAMRTAGFSPLVAAAQVADEHPEDCRGAFLPSCRDVWDLDADGHTCGQRVTYMRDVLQYTETEAHLKVGWDHPTPCWPCAEGAAPPPLPTKPRTLVWADEFEGTELDTTRWGAEEGGGGWGNEELQEYAREAASVSDGVLRIVVEKTYGGYRSARLTTRGKASWRYGRMEARLRLPTGTGVWPAFWMLSEENTYGGWPDSGEIDILENVGYEPGIIHGTAHTKATAEMGRIGVSGCAGNDGCWTELPSSPADQFRRVAVEWTEDRLKWYVDDILYSTYPRAMGATRATWPFDRDFHIILNVAVGGTWGGAHGVDDSAFPTVMEVDYVRVYQ